MTKQDYLFKTIEFTKVDEVTPYAVTKIKPVLSGNMYANHPNETFIYSSLEEMTRHLKALLNYNDTQINDYISTLQVTTVRTYYKPLYTIKWYIGGLYDYMHTNQYISATNKDSLFIPLIDDSKIKDGQNEKLGYAFPERLMKLIRNKPINRIRMYIKAAPTNTYYKSDLHYFDNFQWVNTSQFNPNQGESVGIKVPGNNSVNTYMWVVYGATTNDTMLTSSFDPTLHRYIGISCNNISNNVKTLPDANADPNNRWPEYSWQEISLSDPDPEDDPDTPSYVDLGSKTYYLYIRYSDGRNSEDLSQYSVDSRGKLYRSIGFYLSLTQPSSYKLGQYDTYKWYSTSTTSFKNVIQYDIDNKRYFLYIRFTDNSEKNVYNNISDSNDIAYIRASFFNTSNITTNYSFTNISSYDARIPFNVYANNKYLHGSAQKYAWIKFADTLESDVMYDYGIYKNNAGNDAIRNYLFIGIDKDTNTESTNNSDYYKVQIYDLTTEYSYNAISYGTNGSLSNYYFHIKFAERIPQTITDTTNYYSLSKTVYIGISITDMNGQLHNIQSNQETPLDTYIWVPIRELNIPTQFTKQRYVYFTYTNDITNPDSRSQCPVYTNEVGALVNKKVFGYACDYDVSIDNTHKRVNELDKTSREITLYRADKLNAISEANIHKITSINIPYTTMGKYSVFNFDSLTLNDNEYLIIGGNRDNTCALTCTRQFDWVDGMHPDYMLANTDAILNNEDRPQVTNEDTMYYTNANFLALANWTPVTGQYLPIDIGCGFATASNEVQVTTKSFKEIVEETQLNDEVALNQYKEEHSNKYTAPNYNLYVNLTYKFAKIIDGNVDYMPLYNRYKIKYKFKNEQQQILQQMVFDTSVITPDGSIYDKPEQIIINDSIYTKNSQKYLDYFDYIEGDFTQTIKETDREVKDRDYDVAYFQCNNILEQLYQTNDMLSDDYHNYKFLADDSHKEYLPVLCEVTISAYDTNTALYTRAIPVTLAAYSLVEITDDYIMTTVSKIENDYIYGLTQRTSRIEQYADRISMSVQNVTQGLYSRIQMTEDKILMEVVDASKNIGSMFNMTAQKIQSLVYDTSDHMYSQILQEKNKISLEVANDFRKAGIYLTANSATIDAPNIVLRGDRTTVIGTLQINQKKNQGKGIVMFDDESYDRIHVTTEELPPRLSLAGAIKPTPVIIEYGPLGTFTTEYNINIFTNIHNSVIIDTESYNIEFVGIEFTRFKFTNPIDREYISYITDILDLSKIRAKLKITPRKLKEQYTSRNVLYGAGEPEIIFQWEYDDGETLQVLPNDGSSIITIYNGVNNQDLPVIHFSGIPSESITITIDNSELLSDVSYSVYDTNYYKINYTINQNGESAITASYAATIDGTVYSGSVLYTLKVQALPTILFKRNNIVVNTCSIYYDDIPNTPQLPKMVVTNGNISDITVNISSNKIAIDNEGQLYIVDQNNITSADAGNITVTATFRTKTTTLTIKIENHFSVDIVPQIVPGEPEYEWDPENSKEFDIEIVVDKDFKDFNWTSNQFYIYDYEHQGKHPSIQLTDTPSEILVEFQIMSVEWKPLKIEIYKNYTSYTQLANWNYSRCSPYGKNLWFTYGLQQGVEMDEEAFFSFTFKFGGISPTYFNAIDIVFDGIETFTHPDYPEGYYDHISVRLGYLSSDANVYEEDEEWGWDSEDVQRQFSFSFDLYDGYKESGHSAYYYGNQTYIKYKDNKTIVTLILGKIAIGDWYGYYVHNLFNHILYNQGRIWFYVGASGDPASINKMLKIDSIELYKIDYKVFQLQTQKFPETYQQSPLSVDCGCKLYWKNAVTEGTRIAKDGMYSYQNSHSLFYLSTDYIEQRIDNSGLRISKDLSESFQGSAGIEVFYANDPSTSRWSNNMTWVSLFNYKPILRFYASVDNYGENLIYHVPEQRQTFNDSTGKWHNGITDWYYESLPRGVLAQNDTDSYWTWRYSIEYHRGDISIENLNPDQSGTHIIILPMGYWYSSYKCQGHPWNYNYEPVEIPIGFCINIMNCQYCSDANWKDGTTGTIGVPKKRIIVCVSSQNTNFIYTTVYNNGSVEYSKGGFSHGYDGSRTPANFLDAHGDYCAFIEMTELDGGYLTNPYNDNSFATFIWNGFIWKASIDVDTRGQTGQPNNK